MTYGVEAENTLTGACWMVATGIEDRSEAIEACQNWNRLESDWRVSYVLVREYPPTTTD